jgi:ABC-type enterochelin transport system ATPase subunit
MLQSIQDGTELTTKPKQVENVDDLELNGLERTFLDVLSGAQDQQQGAYANVIT